MYTNCKVFTMTDNLETQEWGKWWLMIVYMFGLVKNKLVFPVWIKIVKINKYRMIEH